MLIGASVVGKSSVAQADVSALLGFQRGIEALTSARHCDDVLDRMHDPLDLVCQRLKGVAHLLDVWVPVIDAALATDDVTETAFGDVRIDACTRHQRARAVRRRS